MIVKLFVKNDCPRCPAAKKVIEELEKEKIKEVVVERFDAEEVEGMAEAAYYMVMATPTIVVTDNDGKEVKSWRGGVPKLEELKKVGRKRNNQKLTSS